MARTTNATRNKATNPQIKSSINLNVIMVQEKRERKWYKREGRESGAREKRERKECGQRQNRRLGSWNGTGDQRREGKMSQMELRAQVGIVGCGLLILIN